MSTPDIFISDYIAQKQAPASGNPDSLPEQFVITGYHRKLPLEEIRQMAEYLANDPRVDTLNMNGMQLGAEGAGIIAGLLKGNTSIKTVHFRGSHIGDEGARAFAEALRENKTLTYLDLGDNKITSKGAQALIDAIEQQNTTLEHLSLGSNRIGKGILRTAKAERAEQGEIWDKVQRLMDRNLQLRASRSRSEEPAEAVSPAAPTHVETLEGKRASQGPDAARSA